MNKYARCGSTLSGALKYFSMGSISLFAIAARRRGAPVKLCNAAPRIERIMPICTTAGIGHASVAVRRLHEIIFLHKFMNS